MISVRSVTFFDSNLYNQEFSKEKLKMALESVKHQYKDLRTVRFTLPPIELAREPDLDQLLIISHRRSDSLIDSGFRWINQPVICNDFVSQEQRDLLSDSIKKLLSINDKFFSSIISKDIKSVETASKLYSSISKSLARVDKTGFSNFRFGAGFNLQEATPFFPFSFSTQSGFSIAVEIHDLFDQIWDSHGSFNKIENKLREELTNIDKIASKTAKDLDISYLGLDCSLAPLPNSPMTVCGLIEKITGAIAGSPGFLTGVSQLTKVIKSSISDIKSSGFNGVMLSVLEDDVLASRFATGNVTINDLILYSSVCGCGIDMVPISENTSEVSLTRLAGDVASLAFRLNKPLGIRTLTIPYKNPGEMTSFNHDFLTNTVIQKV
tara:strand:- start:2176 stop:3315 length:1140 start_codon:yes stop_codon:yes gene_type:complete